MMEVYVCKKSITIGSSIATFIKDKRYNVDTKGAWSWVYDIVTGDLHCSFLTSELIGEYFIRETELRKNKLKRIISNINE